MTPADTQTDRQTDRQADAGTSAGTWPFPTLGVFCEQELLAEDC